MKEKSYELHYNYYHYADPLSMQGSHKGIEKFLSLDAAKSARENILNALKYNDAEDQTEIMSHEQYDNLINQFGFNGHFIKGVEIYEVIKEESKKLIE